MLPAAISTNAPRSMPTTTRPALDAPPEGLGSMPANHRSPDVRCEPPYRATMPSASYRSTMPSASYRATMPSASYRATMPSASYRATMPSASYRATKYLAFGWWQMMALV